MERVTIRGKSKAGGFTMASTNEWPSREEEVEVTVESDSQSLGVVEERAVALYQSMTDPDRKKKAEGET